MNQNLMNSRMTGTMIFVCNTEKCVLHHNLLISVTAENQKKRTDNFITMNFISLQHPVCCKVYIKTNSVFSLIIRFDNYRLRRYS